MEPNLKKALILGYERMVSRAELLNRINVFPVPDSDTGTNLKISLAPLRQPVEDRSVLIRRLLGAATGNSGNIAACFFSGFLSMDAPSDLPAAARAGRDKAWQAIGDPKPGTMLTLFDELVNALETETVSKEIDFVPGVVDRLQQAVLATSELLPDLKQAGVVDAGALGMFLYLEGFLRGLANETDAFLPITEIFRGKLRISPSYHPDSVEGFCVDSLLRIRGQQDSIVKQIAQWGDSLVVVPDQDRLKIHLHTDNPQAVRERLQSLGEIIRWSGDRMDGPGPRRAPDTAIHIMTDAAGTVTAELARNLGMTLLDSYIIVDNEAIPETLCNPDEIYTLMRSGTKVTTAQASVFERSQCYQGVLEQHEQVLYICVGSVYTGNYGAVTAWKKDQDPEGRMKVIDSGAASGRLGTAAVAAAEFALQTNAVDRVVDFAQKAAADCEEFVFPERLEYLVAGGRLSKTKGFLGDLFHAKPVISPTAQGAVKAGVVRDQQGQLEFALKRLGTSLGKRPNTLIMIEYTDNRQWVSETVEKEIRRRYPETKIMVLPLSLTSGVHMGPGTWALAFLPGYEQP
jgi:uncharacterized protein